MQAGQFDFGFFILSPSFLFFSEDFFLYKFEIRKNEFEINCFNIADRVNHSMYMGDVIVVKASDYMGNCLNTADVA